MNKYDYFIMLEAIRNSIGISKKDFDITFILERNPGIIKMTKVAEWLQISRPTAYLWFDKFKRDRDLISRVCKEEKK